MSVSERIFEALKNSGKKQVDLAKAVGVRSNTVSDWKNKDASPSAELIYPIAQFLGVSCEYLLAGKDSGATTNTGSVHTNNGIIGNTHAPVIIKNGSERTLSDQENELLRIFNRLDIRDKTDLLSYAFSLEDKSKK